MDCAVQIHFLAYFSDALSPLQPVQRHAIQYIHNICNVMFAFAHNYLTSTETKRCMVLQTYLHHNMQTCTHINSTSISIEWNIIIDIDGAACST